MRLLDRYLLRELLVPLGYCLGGFLIFWVTFDLFSELSSFRKARLLAGDIAEYYLVKTPELLVTVIPVSLLLALLYVLTNHSRHHELVAIRAAGVGLWRMIAPYLGVGLVCSLVVLALNEMAVPHAAERADKIHARRSAQVPTGGREWQRNVNFIQATPEGVRVWYIGKYSIRTFEMQEVHIEWTLPDRSQRKITAAGAIRTNGQWLLLKGTEVVVPVGRPDALAPVAFDERLMESLNETPRLIRSEILISKLNNLRTARRVQFSIGEIAEYLRLHPQLDAGRRDLLRTMMHTRVALPWTCLLVVFIAIPFGAASGRRNVFVGVASSVFICFVFFVTRELAQALGGGGTVPPWLAAWAPNLLFGATGLWLTHRTR